MLDFGFSEILLTTAIALVVLGPEKLPKVARQVGNWMGRARLMARQLSEQLEREVNAEELLKQQTRSSIPPPAPVPPAAALAAPAVLAPAEAVSPPAVESTPLIATVAPEAAAASIAPEAVVAPPVRRRTPHPNSPEMMHAKERMQDNSPAAVQPSTTPAPTSAEPQQSSQ
jgi:sec-independent protein translocase protein TatB